MEKRRLVAKKVMAWEIENGRFFYGNGEEMKPSYLITPFGEKVSRVNIVGTITFKFESDSGNYASLVLDDGTSSVRIKCFGKNVEEVKEVEEGDLVMVIGKLREYEGEVYVNAEIVKKVSDPNYEILRKLEILKKVREKRKMMNEIKVLIEEMSEEDLRRYVKEKFGMNEEELQIVRESLNLEREIDYKAKLLDIIDQLDKGDGVEIVKIFEVTDLPDNVIENTIDELLAQGFLYEPSPGKFKRVK